VASLHRSAARTVQPDRSAPERLAGQVSWTVLPGQDRWDKSAGTGQPGQVSWDRLAKIISPDRSAGAVFYILFSNGDSAHK
jgi:hypothetical protein